MVPQADGNPLVLASASPRRRTLLAEIGARFEAFGLDIDERPIPGEEATVYARRVAGAKARAAVPLRPGKWILGADTVVEIDGAILGKPPDAAAARDMLSRLSGRTHRVITAVTLIGPDGVTQLDEAVVSQVRFKHLAAQEIDAYLLTGEPFDKAGAYAVQGLGGRHVESVEGSYSSVVGLPLELVKEALIKRGLLG
jgi:septum formation protein